MNDFLDKLIRVRDASEETFELFATVRQDGADLGMVAPADPILDLSIGNHDFTIQQSPGLLRSNNTQGTTGAAVWQSGVRLARWLATPGGALFTQSVVPADGKALELGCGISGIVSTVLATSMSATGVVVATDMAYTMKGLRLNLAKQSVARKQGKDRTAFATLKVAELDWETDDVASLLQTLGLEDGVDLVVACDCVYNYALVQPFLDTCAAACNIRSTTEGSQATYCLIVQQLRQSEVLEEWLEYALTLFDVWRMPTEIVGKELVEEQGFVAYLLRLSGNP